jgi:antitoxin (DNA-binding transcriptional repressor) of toxin-antitoxin stability system
MRVRCYNQAVSTITAQEIEQDPAAFLRRLELGEELVVLKDEQALAHVQPVPKPARGKRPYGLAKGEFKVPDDFDAPLPEDVLAAFEGQ